MEREPDLDHEAANAVQDHFGRVEGAMKPPVSMTAAETERWVQKVLAKEPLPAGATTFWIECLFEHARRLDIETEAD